MNITERILQSPLHPQSDVRQASTGGTYPHSVVLRMCRLGNIYWEGFHATRGIYTGRWVGDRDVAIADIQAVSP